VAAKKAITANTHVANPPRMKIHRHAWLVATDAVRMVNGGGKKTAGRASRSSAADKKREATLNFISFIPHAQDI
jgi:hypothetical protein